MIARRRPRLTRDDWLLTGLTALCEGGPGTLGAEPLARRVGATKGSFYWHFKDVPDFHGQLLGRWEKAAKELLASESRSSASK